MNILIVNAFGDSNLGKNNFNSFFSLIKSSFKKVSENSGIEKFNYIIRTPMTIGDFTYSNFTNPFEETSDSKNRKNFNSLDMIFIDGVELYLPWKKKSEKLFEFIKLCKTNNKVLFVGGVAFQSLIYYLSTSSMIEYTIINTKSKIKSLEELQKFPSDYFKGTKRTEIFLDYVTGDLLGYKEYNNSWEPFMNIGLHHQIYAEKYFNRGKFVIDDSFKYQNKDNLKKISHSYYNMKDVISSEIKIKSEKKYISHYLLKNCSSEFVAYCSLEWFPHFINVSSKKYQYKIICKSNRGPCVIEHENTVGVLFHPNKKFWDSSFILANFIEKKFDEVKDKLLGVKSTHNKYLNEEKENSVFDKIINNNNMIKEYRYKYSLIGKVTNSCLFNKTKLVKHDAKHVGQGINNREMIFVENNNINQRIFLRFKDNMKKIKIIRNNKDELKYETPRNNNKKIKLLPKFFLLNKKSKRVLTSVKKIKKSKDLILNLKDINNSNINKNCIRCKSQNIQIKNNYNIFKTERGKDSNNDEENENIDDFQHYHSKYPRLPTLIELEKIKDNINYIEEKNQNKENNNKKKKYFFNGIQKYLTNKNNKKIYLNTTTSNF